MAMAAGPDQRDHEHRARCASTRVRARRPAARPRPVGRALDRRAPRARGRRRGVSSREADLLAARTPPAGAERARLRFEPEGAEVRVPAARRCSTPRAGTASRSTRRAAGTARARSARCACVEGELPVSLGRPARVHARRAARRLAAGLPRARARRPRDRGAAAADAAEGGAGRRRPPRDPAARRSRSATSCSRSRRWRTSARTSSACCDALDDLEPRAGLGVLRTLGRELRARELGRHRGRRRRRADRRRAGRHDRRGASRSRSTSARRRSSRRCSTWRRARPPRCARCSTASSRSAPT